MIELAKGLVGHWTMDDVDTEGSTLKDRSGYDNHGSIEGNVTTGAASPIGDAYQFNGWDSGERVDVPINAPLTAYTVSFWINTHEISNQEGTNDYREPFYWGGARFTLETSNRFTYRIPNGDNQAWKGTLEMDLNTWTHVVATYDGSEKSLYFDGEFHDSVSVGTTEIIDTGIAIGGRRERTLNGRMADVRVYNRVLSPEEINVLSNMRSSRRQTMDITKDLIVHLPADETHYRDGEHRDRGGYDYHGSASSPTFTEGAVYPTAVESSAAGMQIPFNGPMFDVFSGYELTIALWWKQTPDTTSDWTDFIRYKPVDDESARLERADTGSAPDMSDYWTTLGVQRTDNLSTSDCGVPREEWFHLTMRRFEGGYEIYVNGDLDQSISIDYQIPEPDPTGSLTIDQSTAELSYQDVRIYNRALSPTEIKQLADMRRPREVIA